MANYFILGSDGKEYGPVTDAELRQWIAEGRVDAPTKIKAQGDDEWKLLSEMPEFAAIRQPPTPPLAGVPPPVKAKTSGMAITSLVLGMLGLFTCGVSALFGLIFGIIALVKVSNSKGSLQGKGLALTGTILSATFLFLLPIFAAMLLPAFSAAHDRAREIVCVNNEKQLALAVRIYADKNNGHFPPAATWCDAIKTSVGSQNIFQCPAVDSMDFTNRSSYAFNAKLDGLEQSKVDPQTVMIFESDGGWDAHGGPELLPAIPHHSRGSRKECVVAFADGHVEMIPVARISSLRWEP